MQNIASVGTVPGSGFNRHIVLFALFAAFFSAVAVPAQAVTSNGTGGGNWSDASTWNPASVPLSSDGVTILAGDAVTVDITTATASTTTVNGTLQFSPVTSSTFTLVQGSMTVAAGGTLTLGTAASPIVAGSTATLVLAYGASAGQYGLTINNGGNFIVYGSTKTPWTTATGTVSSGAGSVVVNTPITGWAVGDLITIDTEAVTITSLSGGSVSFSPPLTLNHVATTSAPVRVNDLSRNAVVRSSGTSPLSNTAYIQNLATNVTSFALTYGEFAYLGKSACGTVDCGLTFDGVTGGANVTGIISSSTIRNGWQGLVFSASQVTPAVPGYANSNLIFNNSSYGVVVSGISNITLAGNMVYAQASEGIRLDTSPRITVRSNAVYNNVNYGIDLKSGSPSCTLLSNSIYNTSGNGIALDAVANTLLVSNMVYNNTGSNGGLWFANSPNSNTLIANRVWNNSPRGINIWDGTLNVFADGFLGYYDAATALSNGTGELALGGGLVGSMILKNTLVNPTPGLLTAGFDMAGSYLVNYSTTPGVLQVYGDYTVTASTLAVSYASRLYSSTATAAVDMSGHGSVATVVSTTDTYAVSQLITITNTTGSDWQVWGSSSGTLGSTFTSPITNQPFPNGSTPQFYLTFTQGGSHAVGDVVNFALLAASTDTGRQKQLQFAATNTALNQGRSKLTVAPGAGFQAVGVSSAPTVIDWLSSANTFYTFVDSGTLTLAYTQIQHADEQGIQLSGTGGISISSSSFDYSGTVVSSNNSNYITARSLTSNTTFYSITFNNTWSSGTSRYNVWASTETNLNWYFTNWGGARGGSSFEKEDANVNKVVWGIGGDAGAACTSMTSNGIGGGVWSDPYAWSRPSVPTTCNAVTIRSGDVITIDTGTATASTTTVNGTLQFGTVNSSTFTLVMGSMTVAAGGTLTLGTAANPIVAGSTATLILAYGSGTGSSRYGLQIQNGGNFIVYGSTKTPWTTASADVAKGATTVSVNTPITGWSVGDLIIIDTEAVTVTALSGADVTFTPSVGQVHYATMPVVVGNLSRNAVVKSSGTTVTSNTAYIDNLVTNATSFSLNYGEFAYLGVNGCSGSNCGIAFNGSSIRGSISSSTIRNGHYGFYGSDQATLASNTIYNSNRYGIDFEGNQNTLVSNAIVKTTQQDSLVVFGSNNSISSNIVRTSGNSDISVQGNKNALSSNNRTYMLIAGSDNSVFADQAPPIGNLEMSGSRNIVAAGAGGGLSLSAGADNVLLQHAFYQRPSDIYISGSLRNTLAGCFIGYSTTSVALPASNKEIVFEAGATESLILKKTLVNPSRGIELTGFALAGSYLLNYSTNVGVAEVYGDYVVSGSTLALDYASPLYTSTATLLRVMKGSGTSFRVPSTVDATALNQLVTVTWDGSAWQVWGSSTGSMGSFSASGSTQSFPASNSQFSLSLTYTSPSVGDRADFALQAASGDANEQKKLQFAQHSAALNQGRSKMSIASGAGFQAVGSPSSPTLINWMSPGGTYYTFVDSGTFTVQYATFTNLDENGVWLSGSGGASLNNVTFDYAGSGVRSSSTYITVNSLTSTGTMNNLEFLKSRSNYTNYNVTVSGTDTGLSWTMQNYYGIWSGANYERNDPSDKVKWGYTRSSNGFWNVMD